MADLRFGHFLVFEPGADPANRSRGGCRPFGGAGGAECMIFADTDSALEWFEERLLGEIRDSEEGREAPDNWLAAEIGSEEMLPRLAAYLEVKGVSGGRLPDPSGRRGR